MASEERCGEDVTLAALGPWYCALREATSGVEVVALANDFIRQWGPHELAALPSSCLPWRMSSVSDIDLYAYLLSNLDREDAGSGSRLALMLSFFKAASIRLGQFTRSTAYR